MKALMGLAPDVECFSVAASNEMDWRVIPILIKLSSFGGADRENIAAKTTLHVNQNMAFQCLASVEAITAVKN